MTSQKGAGAGRDGAIKAPCLKSHAQPEAMHWAAIQVLSLQDLLNPSAAQTFQEVRTSTGFTDGMTATSWCIVVALQVQLRTAWSQPASPAGR